LEILIRFGVYWAFGPKNVWQQWLKYLAILQYQSVLISIGFFSKFCRERFEIFALQKFFYFLFET